MATRAKRPRDRVKELRWVSAAELRADPRNFRRHPPAQREALEAMQQRLGVIDAMIAREDADGSLVLVDGHLRTDLAGKRRVPVLIVDLDEREAAEALLTLDPIAAMAVEEETARDELLASVDDADELVQFYARAERATSAPVEIPRVYEVIVHCASEAEQQRAFALVSEGGFQCRVVSL